MAAHSRQRWSAAGSSKDAARRPAQGSATSSQPVERDYPCWTRCSPQSGSIETRLDGWTPSGLLRSFLFTRDINRTAAFYGALGFAWAFCAPSAGTPIHIDLVLDGYRLGLATETSTREDHGLTPVTEGQRVAVILWTDGVPTGYARLIDLGAKPIKTAETWLDRLLIAWIEDPDGHLVQVVQALN